MDRQTETDEQDGWMDSIKVYVCVCVHIRIVWAGGGGRERRMCGQNDEMRQSRNRWTD